MHQFVHPVKIEVAEDPEPVPQGGGQQPDAGGGPDEREALQPKAVAAGMHAFVENEINGEILHGRIEQFLHRFGKPVDLVDEQYVAGLQVREDADQVSALFKGRPGGDGQVGPHFVGDDVGQRGLAEPRGPVQQHVVDRLAALGRRLDGDLEGFNHIPLADIVGQQLRPQRNDLRLEVLFADMAGEQPLPIG